MNRDEGQLSQSLPAIPTGVWGVGFVNLFINISTVMVYSVASVFLVNVLGASAFITGLMDGVVEAVALGSRIFSGIISDYARKRKFLLYIGYGLQAISRVTAALSGSIGLFFSARLIDRLGNGAQAAPRDAFIGDIAPSKIKGSCFGLRHGLTVIGSFLGPLAVIPIMQWTDDDFHAVFWASLVPALLGIITLYFVVKEPKTKKTERSSSATKIRWGDVRLFPVSFWLLLGVSSFFMLARFSEAFLILRTKELGLSVTYISLVMLVMNIFNALSAYPAGWLSDKFDRRILLASSFLALLLSNVVLGYSTNFFQAFVGVGLWGMQMGISQSILTAMIADCAPKKLRATAFGIFYLLYGALHLVASLLAGYLWDEYSSTYTFFVSGAFSLVALLGTAILRKSKTI